MISTIANPVVMASQGGKVCPNHDIEIPTVDQDGDVITISTESVT